MAKAHDDPQGRWLRPFILGGIGAFVLWQILNAAYALGQLSLMIESLR